MTILDKIIETKKLEVAEGKQNRPVKELESSVLFARQCISFSKSIVKPGASGIIAEFKRQSPSKGIINDKVAVKDVAEGYFKAGVSAMSVLTDKIYFGGNNNDLIEARAAVQIPIIRKEFIIDEYQIVEAKSIGADAILLIAACLTKQEIVELTDFAHSLNLEILLELHDESELKKVYDKADMIGINNRNLKNFVVDVDHAIKLAQSLPKEMVKIAESGLNSPLTVAMLRKEGFHGFLMGEHFMKTENTGETCRKFIEELNLIEKR
jgi:indole-3-glycerol phosphate synthase